MAGKKEELKVQLVRLNSSVPGGVEYIIGTIVPQKGDKLFLTNMLRAICWLVPQKTYRQGQDGGVQEVVVNVKRWEFHVDDYFTEQVAEITPSAISYQRELKSDEILYENYLTQIDAYKISLAENEAKKKIAELKAKGGNRAARRSGNVKELNS